MVKETLVSVLQGGSPVIVAFFLSYSLCWTALIASCYVLNWKKVNFKHIIPWVFGGASYSILAQTFFPFAPCIIGVSLILFLCLWTDDIKPAQSFGSVLVVLLSSIFSSLPFASLATKFDAAWALILGSISESIGPMFVSTVIKIFSKR